MSVHIYISQRKKGTLHSFTTVEVNCKEGRKEGKAREAMSAALKTTTTTELQTSKRWKDRGEEISPERTKIWTEPSSNNNNNNNNNKVRSSSTSSSSSSDRRVPVIYYLSRNGQLEHPHFMEVPLVSSPDGGLYLSDVMNRLNFLRGKGMASMYSWSSKRGYKNGYVWHDLSENDFIYPAHGQEYILKGSELLETETTLPKSDETVTFTPVIKPPPETTPPEHERHAHRDFQAAGRRRRNQSWSSFDLHEYKVYSRDSTGRVATDASTQTDDGWRRRRRAIREIEEEVGEDRETTKGKEQLQQQGNQMTELSTDEIFEISPPPSDSSPETLETLLKADGRLISRPETTVNENPTPSNNNLSGRGKASTVLMQLLSCGSIGFKDCGPGNGKENGFSLVSHYKVRLPRGGPPNQVGKDTASGFGGRVKLEDKEYFSGSLIETKKDEFLPTLKKSSSYNADRSSQLELGVKEMIEGSRAKCMPRKPKNSSTKKESNNDLSCCTTTTSSSSSITCSSQHGSKRITVKT